MLNYLFQLLPIVLAIIAAISCSYRYTQDRRKYDRWAMLLAVLSSILLIVAQTSWWATYILNNSLQGTELANFIWTAFNSLVMICLIMISRPWQRN